MTPHDKRLIAECREIIAECREIIARVSDRLEGALSPEAPSPVLPTTYVFRYQVWLPICLPRMGVTPSECEAFRQRVLAEIDDLDDKGVSIVSWRSVAAQTVYVDCEIQVRSPALVPRETVNAIVHLALAEVYASLPDGRQIQPAVIWPTGPSREIA